MSLANKITLARAFLLPLILLFLFIDQREISFALFLLACLGDVLDGMAARSRGEVTAWGKALDPAVDKALYLSLLASLTVLGEVPLLAIILFIIPQVGLAAGALFLHFHIHIVQGARIPGKIAAILTFAAMVFLLLRLPYRTCLLYVSIGAGYLAAFHYMFIAWWAKGSRNRDKKETLEEPTPQSEP